MAIPYTGLFNYPLPLAVIHGLVTISTPGPVQNTFSTEQLQVQDYWDRITSYRNRK
jgi:hypothetical protein